MYEKKELTFLQVKEKALRVLEFRNHSEYELREKLRRAGGRESDIDKAVEFCIEYGFINDENYAIHLAKDLSNLKKYGKMRIKSELYRRGISNEYIQSALEEIEDNSDELERLVEKKLNGNYDRKNCDKAIRYFIYRGYELSQIKSAIERLKTDEF